MRLGRLDLNLLVALDALLTLRSVTAAADRLHLTQPTMSAALGRLREYFEDPLLVQVGRKLQLTALGEMLTLPVHETIQTIERTVSVRSGFDPLTAVRRFTICASEGTVLSLLCDVLRTLKSIAPGVSVDLLPAEPGPAAAMLGRGELSFVFAGSSFLMQDHPNVQVISDPYECIVWNGHQKIRKRMTRDQFLTMGHVVLMHGLERRASFEEHQLQQLEIHRPIEVTCSTPSLLGALVVGTQRIATLPSRLARQQATMLPLRVLPAPLELLPQRIDMYWHRTRSDDPGTQWFRDLVLQTARAIGALPGSATTEPPTSTKRSN